MVRDEHIRELAKISKQIGENPAYVQGGGGNTSVKIDKYLMAVKSSGLTLKEVDEMNGYSIVDFIAINKYLNTPHESDDTFNKTIRSFVVETNNRPSIETGFHALLGAYVIHTHSVFTNVLTCSSEGEEIIKKLFPFEIWIKYKTPGRDLTLEIKKQILLSENKSSNVAFLQNHGVIVWSKSAKKVLEIHKEISNKIKKYLTLTNFVVNEASLKPSDFKEYGILFPDQVVYTMGDRDILNTLGAKENISAYHYIISNIKRNSLTPNYLDKNESRILLEMESEKFRQKIIKNEIY